MPVVRSHFRMSEGESSGCAYHVIVRSRYDILALDCSRIAVTVIMDVCVAIFSFYRM
jgi:hypothetical protein